MLLFSMNRYVRVLGAFYLRLTGTVADVYQYLEPLYNDYRKIRHKLSDGRTTHSPSQDARFYVRPVITIQIGINIWACIYKDVSFFISEFTLTHVDEFIDELLTKDYSCDTALPRIQKRFVS